MGVRPAAGFSRLTWEAPQDNTPSHPHALCNAWYALHGGRQSHAGIEVRPRPPESHKLHTGWQFYQLLPNEIENKRIVRIPRSRSTRKTDWRNAFDGSLYRLGKFCRNAGTGLMNQLVRAVLHG